MPEQPAKIQHLQLQPGRRILVVSDVHANIPYLEGVLRKAGFSLKDELILDGDFLEKGKRSLDMLHLVMKMTEQGNVHPLLGNCDYWHEIFSPRCTEAVDSYVMGYILSRKSGLLWDMLNEARIDPFETESFTECKAALQRKFAAEFDFLASLPYAIETEHFVFAHAGMDPTKPLEEHTPGELNHRDHFRDEGTSFPKWVIVGHWPVMLYGKDIVCANPIVDADRKIISIDGGCVLKDDGQLNCLIIPDKDSEDFLFTAYDPFPTARVLQAQEGSQRSYYIRWGDSTVRVLKRGDEFSLCRHERTGYTMEILTKYLFTDNDVTDCNDCTDYVLPLKAGDEVSVVERTSKGYFVKHKGVSGWYFGALEENA